jgi:phosphohistidine phosphatase
MPTLSLFRHAKSSWADPGQQDFDRPLNERGLDAAPRMGVFMAGHGITPDLVLCSPSARTRQTLDLVLPHFSAKPTILYEDTLYLASASTLIKRIRKLNASIQHAMIVAHDPGLHRLAMELPGSGDPEVMQALAEKFPTSGLAVIVFEGRGWSRVKPGGGRLKLFMTPKRLP